LISKEYVTMKGTRGGILVNIHEECPFAEAVAQFRASITQNQALFHGSPLSVDLGWREVGEGDQAILLEMLGEMGVRLLGVISTSLATRRLFEARGVKAIIGSLGLARHGGRSRGKAVDPPSAEEPEQPVEAPAPPEEIPAAAAVTLDETATVALADPTMLVRKTLRSGQKVQYAGNVVVLGDVNAGAEVVAGGDVIVLGNVRGTVHAGVGGKAGAVVLALNLHAPQVRIGDVIGFVNAQKGYHNNAAVMARIHEGNVATTLYGN